MGTVLTEPDTLTKKLVINAVLALCLLFIFHCFHPILSIQFLPLENWLVVQGVRETTPIVNANYEPMLNLRVGPWFVPVRKKLVCSV